MDQKRILVQIRNCSKEEETAVREVLAAIFPMLVEGEDPVLLGYVDSAEAIVIPAYDEGGEPLQGELVNDNIITNSGGEMTSAQMGITQDMLDAATLKSQTDNAMKPDVVEPAVNNVFSIPFEKNNLSLAIDSEFTKLVE